MPLFVIKQGRLSTLFTQACRSLQLEDVGILHMYQLRHGGASHDAVSGSRTLEAVRRRGRWRSWSSMRRYEKGARLGEVLHRLSSAMQALAVRCAACVGRVVAGSCLPLLGR